ncbi:homoserine kinase [Clostridium cochlearium]|jgi:homoserine kinase|uniref:Homoserine kinase n=1 Tax=Clostridium cochlearium TaxID=1494 RepID=A0A240AV70_CLOCO|nr:homoserine kinase [Clostridium cochlearium]NSJ91145.1 homoserine kinase [Coprococcus sp. MSK.21.13]MBU5268655.1 homoserine kinase [Clostridium cochlearium]MCG4571656.1 homoserine kinase [Clostridium cochlearium]MCR1970941.1 homoserine kinase [Clostridium cochlearium]SDK91281.1 homoserine kinase [Clostridium cochlearium]
MLEIKVPGTSANFGPGFDSLGVALNIYNKFYVEETEKGLYIEGCEEKYRNDKNLFYVSMKKVFDKFGYNIKGLKIKIESDIPESRGLGSSASCIVGGVMAANGFIGNKLSKEEILEISTEIEGHPDNVAPSIFGGMTVVVKDENKIYHDKINIDENINFYALIPDFVLSTKESREVLPKTIDYKDGVFNVGRVALMIASLVSGNHENLKIAFEDRLHQPYRKTLIENYDNVIKKCKKNGALGTFLSGAGPTIMALTDKNNEDFMMKINSELSNLNHKWNIRKLSVDHKGAIVIDK